MAYQPDFDVFKIADENSKIFLGKSFLFYTKPETRERIKDDPLGITIERLAADAYLVEMPEGSSMWYLTGAGRDFIQRGGYEGQFQYEEQQRQLTKDQINSTITTNESVVATNESVRKTLKINIYLFRIAILSTFATLVAAFMPYFNDNEKHKLKQQLQDKTHQIEVLHKQLLQQEKTNQIQKTNTSFLKK